MDATQEIIDRGIKENPTRADLFPQFNVVKFERATGLKGVAGHYAMPQGTCEEGIEADIKKRRSRVCMCEQLIELSGDLDRVPDIKEKPMLANSDPLRNDPRYVKLFQLGQEALAEWGESQKRAETDETYSHSQEFVATYELLENKLQVLAVANALFHSEEGLDVEKLWAVKEKTAKEHDPFIRETYRKLEALNPQIKALGVSADDPELVKISRECGTHVLEHVVMGITTQINIPDIQLFAVNRIHGGISGKKPGYNERRDEITQRLIGCTPFAKGTISREILSSQAVRIPGWIMSSSTQMKILEQLRQREPKQASR